MSVCASVPKLKLRFILYSRCASYVGYIKTVGQKIWLAPGCLWVIARFLFLGFSLYVQCKWRCLRDILRGHFQTSVILHEILHALGAWHEQERPDRQGNINVLFENIAPYAVYNFAWKHTHEYGPYDLGSVLQYGLSVCRNERIYTRKICSVCTDSQMCIPVNFIYHDEIWFGLTSLIFLYYKPSTEKRKVVLLSNFFHNRALQNSLDWHQWVFRTLIWNI